MAITYTNEELEIIKTTMKDKAKAANTNNDDEGAMSYLRLVLKTEQIIEQATAPKKTRAPRGSRINATATDAPAQTTEAQQAESAQEQPQQESNSRRGRR